MTAKELIKWLQECPEDTEVRFQVCSRFWTDEYSIDDWPSVEDDIIVLRAFLDDESFKTDVKKKIDKLLD